MKKNTFRSFRMSRITAFFVVMLMLYVIPSYGQRIASQHKVQKQETLFGISKMYGVSIDQLRDANPMMREADFTLKKGMVLNIPEVPTPTPETTTQKTPQSSSDTPKSNDGITVGVMLPLHNINGDGKRMLEYYRGMLLAVRALKREGYNITINSWNVAEDSDIRNILLDPKASSCNIIFGPLYSKQVASLADFCMKKSIHMVIPFSITGNDVQTCPQIFQVYQTQADLTAASINEFLKQFSDSHPVFIDCNDATSQKGGFTFGLRNVLTERGIDYSITNLDNSSDEMFLRSLSPTKRNVIVLNSGRSPELGRAFQRLDRMKELMPSLKISMFGYNEWFMYANIYQERFRRYDAYIPSFYDYNPESSAIKRLEENYKSYFNMPVQQALPRFAITGYDHAMFFLRGISLYGKQFVGNYSQQCYTALQSPLQFERLGNGGYQNRTFMLVHYK